MCLDLLAERVPLAERAVFKYDSLTVAVGSQISYYGNDAGSGEFRAWKLGGSDGYPSFGRVATLPTASACIFRACWPGGSAGSSPELVSFRCRQVMRQFGLVDGISKRVARCIKAGKQENPTTRMQRE